MTDFIKGLQDTFIARINNMLFVNFVMAWLFINYNISLTIFFKKMSIDEKITYIDNLSFDFDKWFAYPILITMIYIYVLPFINLGISKIYNERVNKYIKNHENHKLKEHYGRKKEIETTRLESTTFVEKNLQIEIEKIENETKEKNIKLAERENLANKEKIELAERENLANKEKIELAERENLANKEKIELEKKERKKIQEDIENYKTEFAKKINDINEAEKEYQKKLANNVMLAKEYREQQESMYVAKSQYEEKQKEINETEKLYQKKVKDINDIEKQYMEKVKEVNEIEKLYKEKKESLKEEYIIDDNEKYIIKIIAKHGGKINGKILTNESNFDKVKTEYLIENMQSKYIDRGIHALDSEFNVTHLTKLGKKVAIDEGYVK